VSDAISSIFSNPGTMNAIKAITGIAGTGSNIIGGIKQGQEADQSINHSKMVAALLNNPALMSQKIAALKQPLSQGLVQDVTNTTQGQLAERGLGTSPQIAGAVESQALAPFEQKSQEDAINAFLGTLGISPPTPQFGKVDTSGFWNSFQPKAAPSQAPSAGSAAGGGIAGSVPGTITLDPGDPSI
jgi:hypothetical protein